MHFLFSLPYLLFTPQPHDQQASTSVNLLPSIPQSPKLLSPIDTVHSLSYLTPLKQMAHLDMPSFLRCSFPKYLSGLSFLSLRCSLILKYGFPQCFVGSSQRSSLYTVFLGNLIPLLASVFTLMLMIPKSVPPVSLAPNPEGHLFPRYLLAGVLRAFQM